MKHLRSISARLTLAATLAVGVFGLAVSLLTIEWVHADLDRSVREFARHEVHELANIERDCSDLLRTNSQVKAQLEKRSSTSERPLVGLASMGLRGTPARDRGPS